MSSQIIIEKKRPKNSRGVRSGGRGNLPLGSGSSN
jgi:hypothetical protein